MPRPHRTAGVRRWLPRLLRLLALTLALAGTLPATHAYAAPSESPPQLWLPTPPGEPWKIIQGYACGTHNSWDRYSLDLASAGGRTSGAPVRAAADGTIFVWVPKSGTLILDHGGGFYTMYTHMASAAYTDRGRILARGSVIGTVGDRGSPGTPHLHFTAFRADGSWASNRRSVPLSFAEGYDLPDIGGCNQHGGQQLVAGGGPLLGADGIAFKASVEPGRWYNHDLTIEFGGTGTAAGFSVAWESEPGGEAPMVSGQPLGAAQLAEAGEGLHTLFVRGWDLSGGQSVSSFGPIGFDITPPSVEPMPEPIRIGADQPAVISWEPATDNGSGVAGYRIYIGADPQGTDEWFVPGPEVELPPLQAGTYLLRLQPRDYAGNEGEWTTVASLVVE
nr:MAG: M23 family peptidase [Chloroflexota bacterium]